jgi:hypothetical protein
MPTISVRTIFWSQPTNVFQRPPHSHSLK